MDDLQQALLTGGFEANWAVSSQQSVSREAQQRIILRGGPRCITLLCGRGEGVAFYANLGQPSS